MVGFNLENAPKESRAPYFVLWLLCILGSLSVLPYLYYLDLLPEELSLTSIILISAAQSAVVFGLACFLSYKILPKTDLAPFEVRNFTKQILIPGVLSGLLLGLLIFILNKTLFQDSVLTDMDPPLWAGVLASLYGAINEEVLLRLFLFSLFYFISRKFFANRTAVLWGVNLVVALLFGLGHLPAAFQVDTPDNFEITRILSLNMIPGLVFGWLYWTRGLLAAMLSHFVTDLMVHAYLIN